MDIQIPNSRLPLKGKIYSPSFPQPHRNHRQCIINITGLSNNTWIKFRQVKLSPYKGECISNDFKINTLRDQTLVPFNTSHSVLSTSQCDTLEGTYSKDNIEITMMRNINQASPFYIEYESKSNA